MMGTSTDKKSVNETMEDLSNELLKLEQTLENPVLVDDDDEELFKSLKRASKLVHRKQKEEASGPEAVAKLAASIKTNSQDADDSIGESQEHKVFFTEMDEFVQSLELGKGIVFAPITCDKEREDDVGGWTEVMDSSNDENSVNETKEDIVPDAIFHEVPVGKGLSAALQRLKEQGKLKDSVESGGRKTDKKRSNLVGIVDSNGADSERFKDIRIERTDEFGRMMTPKESFRKLCYQFHCKGPGKMKQEKRLKLRHLSRLRE